jgi:cyclopropane fatty-acyl-phospholipid synthase-like methyltransferase
VTELHTWQIAFRHHAVMNPSSPEKIRLLGERLRLDSTKTVLDLGCGTCGPSLLLASEYGCRITAVDNYEPFLARGRQRAADAGVSQLITFVHEDGARFVRGATQHDVAMCLGATSILGGIAETSQALRDLVPVGGHIVVGDLYLPDGTAPHEIDDGPGRSLPELLEVIAAAGLAPVTMLTASEDDWNTYSSLKWLSVEDWLEENPDHADAPRFRKRQYTSDLMEHASGWAIIAARRPRDLG